MEFYLGYFSEKKVKEGVDVRLIYDDLGCAFKLPHNYSNKLQKLGIKRPASIRCSPFCLPGSTTATTVKS